MKSAPLPDAPDSELMDSFLVAENPDPDSSLPYLLAVPIEGGLILKAQQNWPRSSRVYCHRVEEDWPREAVIVEEVPIKMCRRRGSSIDLVLDRRTNARSQFIFTTIRGREAIFWQTPKAARAARPGVRIPSRRAADLDEFEILVDTRERYPYKFAKRKVTTTRQALPAGDYAVGVGDTVIAAVERKTADDFRSSLTDGTLAFLMAEMSTLAAAAIVVEDRYSALLRTEHVQPGWIGELIARVQVRYPSVPLVFCENRKFGEEWTYRFLGNALAELGLDPPERDG